MKALHGWILAFFALVFAVSASAATVEYKVVTPGIGLIKIAKATGGDWQQIAKENGIKAPRYLVKLGQVLKVSVPSAVQSAAPAAKASPAKPEATVAAPAAKVEAKVAEKPAAPAAKANASEQAKPDATAKATPSRLVEGKVSAPAQATAPAAKPAAPVALAPKAEAPKVEKPAAPKAAPPKPAKGGAVTAAPPVAKKDKRPAGAHSRTETLRTERSAAQAAKNPPPVRSAREVRWTIEFISAQPITPWRFPARNPCRHCTAEQAVIKLGFPTDVGEELANCFKSGWAKETQIGPGVQLHGMLFGDMQLAFNSMASWKDGHKEAAVECRVKRGGEEYILVKPLVCNNYSRAGFLPSEKHAAAPIPVPAIEAPAPAPVAVPAAPEPAQREGLIPLMVYYPNGRPSGFSDEIRACR